MTFEGLLFGGSIIESSYPEMRNIDFAGCTDDATENDGGQGFFKRGFFKSITDGTKTIGCFVGNFFLIIANFFAFLYGTVVLIWSLISFNIPGAPGWVRVMLGTMIGGTVLWVVATGLFRGSKA